MTELDRLQAAERERDEHHAMLLAILEACGATEVRDVLGVDAPLRAVNALRADVDRLERQVTELRTLISSPQTEHFLEAIAFEAAHQVERWGSEHDAGKSDADWFWLIGYLAGKAIRPDATPEKKLHHIITTAAACLNWHRHATGENTSMRPGIQPPEPT